MWTTLVSNKKNTFKYQITLDCELKFFSAIDAKSDLKVANQELRCDECRLPHPVDKNCRHRFQVGGIILWYAHGVSLSECSVLLVHQQRAAERLYRTCEGSPGLTVFFFSSFTGERGGHSAFSMHCCERNTRSGGPALWEELYSTCSE